MKQGDQSDKKLASFSESAIWTAFPSMIKHLQATRIKPANVTERMQTFESQRGLNATIILVSATCIEGFIVDCLKSFLLGDQFASKDTFEGRLDHDFLERVQRATFDDFPDLFRLAIGKPLSELIADKDLIKGVQALIRFRNGIAHGRSFVYLTYEDTEEGDAELDKQYKAVHAYLEEKHLVWGRDEILNNKVADHFASLIKPYMEAVLAQLPIPQSDNVKASVRYAFKYC